MTTAPAADPAPGAGPPGLSTAEAALAFGVTRQTVQRWAQAGKLASTRTAAGHRRFDPAEVGVHLAASTRPAHRRPGPRPGSHRPLPVWAPELAAMYLGGASVRGCAAHFGISYGQAHRLLAVMAVAMRPRGGAPGTRRDAALTSGGEAASAAQWDAAAAAAVLHVSRGTVCRMAARGELAAGRAGRALRVPETVIRGYLTGTGLDGAYVAALLDRARPASGGMRPELTA